MFEFIFEALRPVNLPFTAVMGLVTFYWILVGFGALDFDSEPALDVSHGGDLQVDGTVGGEHGLDASHHDPASGIHGAVKSALQFLHFGDVPSMIIVSVMALSFWTFSMLSNHYFNEGSILRALVLFLPNLVVTILITKAATLPLKKLFTAMNREYEQHQPVLGRTCTIMTSEVTDRFGQAQIETTGAPLVIHVRTYGDATFTKGESALIIKEDKENNLFTVAKLTRSTPSTPEKETHLC